MAAAVPASAADEASAGPEGAAGAASAGTAMDRPPQASAATTRHRRGAWRRRTRNFDCAVTVPHGEWDRRWSATPPWAAPGERGPVRTLRTTALWCFVTRPLSISPDEQRAWC